MERSDRRARSTPSDSMGGPAPHKMSAAAAARRGHRRGAAAALPNGVRRRAARAATRSPARRPALAHPRGLDHGSLTLRARPLSFRRFRSGAVRPHPSSAGAAFRAGETARGAGARPSRTRRTARLRHGTLPHPASAGVSSSPSYCDPRARRARRTREGAPATSGQGETFRPRRQALRTSAAARPAAGCSAGRHADQHLRTGAGRLRPFRNARRPPRAGLTGARHLAPAQALRRAPWPARISSPSTWSACRPGTRRLRRIPQRLPLPARCRRARDAARREAELAHSTGRLQATEPPPQWQSMPPGSPLDRAQAPGRPAAPARHPAPVQPPGPR